MFHPIVVGDIWAAVSSAVCSAGKRLLLLCLGRPYKTLVWYVCQSSDQPNSVNFIKSIEKQRVGHISWKWPNTHFTEFQVQYICSVGTLHYKSNIKSHFTCFATFVKCIWLPWRIYQVEVSYPTNTFHWTLVVYIEY